MNLLTKYVLKKEAKKAGQKIIDKMKALNLNEGVYLNVFNSGIKLDLSEIARKSKEACIKQAEKALKKL